MNDWEVDVAKVKPGWEELTRSYSVWDDKNIKGFFGPYKFLSNFEETEVWFNGLKFGSSEAAYMSAKTLEPSIQEQLTSMSPREAKKFGRQLKLRPDWEEIKFDIMLAVVFDKFWRNKYLRERLLATGDKYLEELNHWRDVTWGVDYKSGLGQNLLGIVLMKVRTCLRRDIIDVMPAL